MNSNNPLTGLWKEEISASEAYQEAMSHTGSDQCQRSLSTIKSEHEAAAKVLRSFTAETPDPHEPGGWDILSKAVHGVEKLYGSSATIRSLQDGEALAMRDYERVLDDEEVPSKCKFIIRSRLIPQAMDHIAILGDLLRERRESIELV